VADNGGLHFFISSLTSLDHSGRSSVLGFSMKDVIRFHHFDLKSQMMEHHDRNGGEDYICPTVFMCLYHLTVIHLVQLVARKD
jgi:hypothetical protein